MAEYAVVWYEIFQIKEVTVKVRYRIDCYGLNGMTQRKKCY
jgi:hypothetical protein